MAKEIFVSFGIDVDAVGGWLGSYGGENSPGDISRGVFAGEVGVPRLAELMRRNSLPATWFWPGHSIETFPEQFDRVVEAGPLATLLTTPSSPITQGLLRDATATLWRGEDDA